MSRSLRPGAFLLVLAVCICILFQAGRVFAQAEEGIRVINVSGSGFEQAGSVSFSPDGSLLAVGGTSGVHLYNIEQLSEVNFLATKTWARSVAFQPGNGAIAAGVFDGSVQFWSGPGYNLSQSFSGSGAWVRSISFSADGALVASASDDDKLRIWNTADGAQVMVIDQDTTGLRAVALAPDGRTVAGAMGKDNAVRIWAVPGGQLLHTLSGHTGWVRCLAFSPDGKLLASGSFDKNILLWNTGTGELITTLTGHTASVLGLAFSPDGKTLASGSVDQTVRLWNVGNASPIRMLQGHAGFVYAVAFSPDGQTLASGGADNAVRLWNLQIFGKQDSGASLVGPQTPSDCRQCHHRRGQVDPARVIELGCETCHEGGISSAWCQGFPRSSRVDLHSARFSGVEDLKGVPVGGHNLAVLIIAPGNGETLYVRGNAQAPEFISGRVFAADRQAISKVVVRLDILSGGQRTASLTSTPSENGEFVFKTAINPQASPPQLSKPGTRQCLVCHGEFVPQAGLPRGEVQIIVTAVTPDGQQASDERWFHVDASNTIEVPVDVRDVDTQKPIAGLSVDAAAILYQWRDRFGSAASGPDGSATLTLDALSQKPTTYVVSIPPQVVNGIKYASPQDTLLKLTADSNSGQRLTLSARAVTGRIQGDISSVSSPAELADMRVWAVQLPAGPAYQVGLSGAQGHFEFNEIPVSRYLVFPDPMALAKQGLLTSSYSIDLFETSFGNISYSLEKGSPLTGRVTTESGLPLPFGWIRAGGRGAYLALDPASGEYFLPGFAKEPSFVTVSAPGYYSLVKSAADNPHTLDFQLTPKPGTRQIPWDQGTVTLPADTQGSGSEQTYSLDQGWLWGQGGSFHPYSIHVPGAEISVLSGSFALEKPAIGLGWFYLYSGTAEIVFDGAQRPVELGAGQMLALQKGAPVISMEPVVAMALHPALDQSPVPESYEPSVSARIQVFLAETGVGALQTVTLITYLLSLVIFIAAPLLVIFRIRKLRRTQPTAQEKR